MISYSSSSLKREHLWSPQTKKHALLIWIGFLILLGIQSETRFGISTTASRIIIPSTIIINVIAYYFLHRGREQIALILICSITWVGLTLIITINSGFILPIWVIYLPLIIVAGLFINSRINLFFIVLTIITIPLIAWGVVESAVATQAIEMLHPYQVSTFICILLLTVGLITRLIRSKTVAVFDEIKAKQHALEDNERRFRAMFDHSADGIVVVGADGRVVQTNKQIELWLGMKPEMFHDIRLTESPSRFTIIMSQMRDDRPYIFRTEYIRTDGSTHSIEVHVVKIEWGNETMLMGTARDVASQEATQLALLESVEEKELLLREIHHRIKNNLQIITSMLRMQARELTEPAILESNQELQTRVNAIALIHQQLYRTSNLAQVEFSRYLRTLVQEIERLYKHKNISFEFDLERVNLTMNNTLTLGLIVNELLTNALKHAFAEEDEGRIWCRLRQNAGVVTLTVSNDGRPLSPQNDSDDSLPKQTMGMHLLTLLTRQLDGTLATTNDKQGTHFTLTFNDDSSS